VGLQDESFFRNHDTMEELSSRCEVRRYVVYLAPLPTQVVRLLEALHAPPRLVAHLRLVHDVAKTIISRLDQAWSNLVYDSPFSQEACSYLTSPSEQNVYTEPITNTTLVTAPCVVVKPCPLGFVLVCVVAVIS